MRDATDPRPDDALDGVDRPEPAAEGAGAAAEQAAAEASVPRPDVPAADDADAGSAADQATAAGGSEDATTDVAEDAAADLTTALEAARAQADEYLDDLQRTRAEFQNFRKRTMREGAAQRTEGATEVLTRLIDVLDDFELAVIAAGSTDEVEALRKGVEMVYGKFVDVLRSFGLERIGAEGEAFDPERHEAVQQVEDGEAREQPVVVEVLRPGYAAGGRVLRAAMVKVAR